MKQITEDYVSFEIAKLLKEKGFDCGCTGLYYENKKFDISLGLYSNSKLEKHDIKGMISAPTHQMALKWLREVHNIYIDILTYTTSNIVQFRWVGYHKGRLFSQEEGKTIYFNSYEQAVKAALLYVLKNLI